MASVSITELKANLSKYIRVVRRGGEVQVLERGVPVARLVAASAPEDAEDRLEALVRAGIVRRGTGDLRWLLERKPVRVKGPTVSQALQEDREDRF